MSGSVPPPPPLGFTPSQASVLGPGIAGIFIQGIESGLVFAQFSQWFYGDRSESSVISAVVIFVTAVGLAQSGICFASAWTMYVQQFGTFLFPDWGNYVHPIPTLVISAPVQALMIRRCYLLVRKNMFIITPLVLLLVASTVTSLWSIVIIAKLLAVVPAKDTPTSLQRFGLSWPYLMSVLLPSCESVIAHNFLHTQPLSVLDLNLTGILLYYLIRTMKRVYDTHTRKLIHRLVNVVWQSALPPTVCAICVSVFYVKFSTARPQRPQFWLMVFQAMIGKLYVLSLFYMINARPLRPKEQPTTFISTLTVPTEVMNTVTRDTRGGDTACGENSAECRPAKTVDYAV
ncbi:hypothetical protein BJY52DRAFT_883715 [Lactarius psammicola]|nr:hypothetical protein BJY52DRAFT_883715 [Lactarius psammicola]